MPSRIARLVVVCAMFAPLAVRAEPPGDPLQVRDADSASPGSIGHRYRVLALETAGLAALGQAWYWRHGASTNAGDWELPGNWSAIRSKLSGDGVRFDGDGFDTNAIGHPIFGTVSFLLAREDGFGVGGSFLYASLTSGLWETFGEWREYASINDLLLTSTSGVPIGEAVHQIVHHARRTRLELTVGAGHHDEAGMTRSIEDVAVRGELNTIPGHDGVADNAGYVTEGKRVRFALDLPIDDVGVRTEQLGVRTSILGYYRNAVTRDEGYRLYIGADAGFDYRHKLDRPDETWDLFTMVGLGPAIAAQLATHGVVVDASLDAPLRTGMVKPWAFDAWRAMNPTAIVRGSIQTNRHGYYHGYGVALEPHLAVTFSSATIGVDLGEGVYRAFRGHDRYDSVITADPDLVDHDTTAAAWLRVNLGRAVLRVDAMARARSGRADDQHASGTEHSAIASVGVAL